MKEKTCVKLTLFFSVITMVLVSGVFEMPFCTKFVSASVTFVLAQAFALIPYIRYTNNKNKKHNEQQF